MKKQNQPKNFFLTLDFEEWYHLEYLKVPLADQKSVMARELGSFIDLLDRLEIKITVFVLGELIDEHRSLIRRFVDAGHEIGVHGWDHNLLGTKDFATFREDLLRTRIKLESEFGCEVVGYRAPCFSMTNEKYPLLKGMGFEYDSSYIKFKDHPLYGDLSMDNATRIDDLVYQLDGIYELELPTMSILGKKIPISGGGYFRLFPKWVFKRIWKRYTKKNKNFNMYLHPFELTNARVDTSGMDLFKRFRFDVGRDSNLDKLEWFLKMARKDGFVFSTIGGFLKNVLKRTESG